MKKNELKSAVDAILAIQESGDEKLKLAINPPIYDSELETVVENVPFTTIEMYGRSFVVVQLDNKKTKPINLGPGFDLEAETCTIKLMAASEPHSGTFRGNPWKVDEGTKRLEAHN